MGNCCVESKTLEFERNSKKQKVPLSNNTSNPNGQSTAVNLNNQANINSLQLKRLSEQINKNDEITYSHEDFMKGEFKGKGRYGSVYSGLCDVSGEIIAIKILDNVPQEKINEILFSIEKLYSLYHKNLINVIKLKDPGTLDENGALSIIYELCNGNSLSELVKKFGTFEEKIIQLYSKEILIGLQYLHQNKVFHKNLRPNNILVDGNGTIRISDALVDSIILGDGNEIYQKLMQNEGSELDYYIPPFFIQNKSKEIDQAYDLWFLGCVIIEITSGKNPWSHYTFQNQKEFISFLSKTHLTPTPSKKLSTYCQDFLSLLFDYKQTKKKDIYSKLLNHEFFKHECKLVPNQNDTNNSQQGLGNVLQREHVVNILNQSDNPTFSITVTGNENSQLNSLYTNSSNLGSSRIFSKGQSSRVGDKVLKVDLNKNINNEVYQEVAANLEQSPMLMKNENGDIYDFNVQTVSLLSKKNV